MATNRERNSDQDKVLLDNTYIESAIFGLFKIDISNYIKVKSLLAKEFHIQPSEIDKMPAWEYELFMKEINNAVKEENERNQTEMDKSDYSKITDSKYIERQQRSMERSAYKKMPSMPNIGSFKIPNI